MVGRGPKDLSVRYAARQGVALSSVRSGVRKVSVRCGASWSNQNNRSCVLAALFGAGHGPCYRAAPSRGLEQFRVAFDKTDASAHLLASVRALEVADHAVRGRSRPCAA